MSAGRSIDDLPLSDLFVESPPAGQAPPRLIEWVGRFEQIVSAFASETFASNLRAIFRGRLVTLDVRPAAIEGSGLHACDFLHRQMFDSPAPLPEIRVTQQERSAGRERLAGPPGRPVLLIHPGSGGRAKCWPIESFLSVAARMADTGWHVVSLLGPAERERMTPGERETMAAGGLPVLAGLSLEQLAGAISAVSAYLGNDSGPTHLAAALGRPTVAIFGPTDPAVWGPRGRRVRVLRGNASQPGWAVSPEAVANEIVRVFQQEVI